MVWRAVGRLIAIPVGFMLAMAAAGVVLVTLGLERATQALHNQTWDPDNISRVLDLALDGSLLLAGATLLPALLVILIGEVARIRSLLYYVVGGGLALAALPLLARIAPPASDAALPVAVWQVLAVAGFAGGLVYWLIAGRWA